MASSPPPNPPVIKDNSDVTTPGGNHSGSGGDRTRKTRGRYGGRPSRRDELLRAAVELFATGGTRGTTLDAIAKQIGVSKAAIIHHFSTKEDLLREVGAISDVLSASAILSEEPSTGMEQLRSLRSWASVVASDPGLANLDRLGVVMAVEAFDPDYPAREDRMVRYQTFRKGLADIVECGQRDGTIRADANPGLVAAEVLAFMEGIGIQWHLDPVEVDIVGAYEGYFDRLDAQLSPSSPDNGNADAKPPPSQNRGQR
ncbi:TetR/AcrR family transcriptional regulator [Mycolicibacterium setense]